MSDWFNREETVKPVVVKTPHPMNTEYALKVQQIEKRLDRYGI
jgi:hypothetical protein